MKDKVGNPENERRADFYKQHWCDEAVPRYFYAKVIKIETYRQCVCLCVCNYVMKFELFLIQMTQQRTQLEQALGIRH